MLYAPWGWSAIKTLFSNNPVTVKQLLSGFRRWCKRKIVFLSLLLLGNVRRKTAVIITLSLFLFLSPCAPVLELLIFVKKKLHLMTWFLWALSSVKEAAVSSPAACALQQKVCTIWIFLPQAENITQYHHVCLEQLMDGMDGQIQNQDRKIWTK